ncbi:MAG: hypothetical protein ACLGQX_13655 [Acidobacteriota bacterium]
MSVVLLRRAACGLHGGQLQYGLNGRPASYVVQTIAGQLALRNQIYHGQQRLPALGRENGQILLVRPPLLADTAVGSFRGDSLGKRVLRPDSFKTGSNRRSTFQLRMGHPRITAPAVIFQLFQLWSDQLLLTNFHSRRV